ncbi:31841_t:CDS:2, partial [Gigaspora margarita]
MAKYQVLIGFLTVLKKKETHNNYPRREQKENSKKWNQKNLLPDSNKEKKMVNRILKSSPKLNQKSIYKEKKITFLYNKENELAMKYKNYYDKDKRKESYNGEKSIYIE